MSRPQGEPSSKQLTFGQEVLRSDDLRARRVPRRRKAGARDPAMAASSIVPVKKTASRESQAKRLPPPVRPSGNGALPAHPGSTPSGTLEELIASAVERAVQQVIGPHLRKLSGPEPVVYTVAQAAIVLQVSQDTVSRLVKRGVLPRVPHLDGKVLIPRCSVTELIESGLADVRSGQPEVRSPASIRSMSSAASRSEPGMK